MKIYLANSLTQAPEEFKRQMLNLREKLKEDYEVLEYMGLADGDAVSVYRHDIDCVKSCDAVVAEVSFPSTGLGIEIATALQNGKKVLAFAKTEARVSRMVQGIADKNFSFRRYGEIDEILKNIKE